MSNVYTKTSTCSDLGCHKLTSQAVSAEIDTFYRISFFHDPASVRKCICKNQVHM